MEGCREERRRMKNEAAIKGNKTVIREDREHVSAGRCSPPPSPPTHVHG